MLKTTIEALNIGSKPPTSESIEISNKKIVLTTYKEIFKNHPYRMEPLAALSLRKRHHR